MDIRVLTLGDSAFTIEFPKLKGAIGARSVRALRRSIEQEVEEGRLPGVFDIISASRSLTVCLNPGLADYNQVTERVSALAQMPLDAEGTSKELWILPACYEGEFAPDLDDVAQRSGLSVAEIIDIHSSTAYDIFLIGFLPGFAFMGEIDARLQFPRRTSPRVRVPAGSVGIANEQTAVYPWESPGGWHLLARCPVPFFNSTWRQPSLLSAGGSVKFKPITTEEYNDIKADLSAERLAPQSFLSCEGES
ncbi:5-oxoprolinase subunit PxpB [Kiloniella majae]|uniref:5-oxoprolinase subunit PxpB n=1 Tax=Kiloniella majae TaxID=1938558 RepID=UPI0015C51FF5|nr:5-oxoprolinase subunit PxpB [Kiloniella majae]